MPNMKEADNKFCTSKQQPKGLINRKLLMRTKEEAVDSNGRGTIKGIKTI